MSKLKKSTPSEQQTSAKGLAPDAVMLPSRSMVYGAAARNVRLAGSSVPRLTDPSMAKSLNALKARIKSDPEYALSLLVRAGIATKTGNLTKRHGG